MRYVLLLIIISACAAAPASAPWPTVTADDYTLALPPDWQMQRVDALSVEFHAAGADLDAAPLGGINQLPRRQQPNEIMTLRPNHSATVATWSIATRTGPATVLLLERSFDGRQWAEQRAYIPVGAFYYEVWLVSAAVEPDPVLVRLVQSFAAAP